MIDFISKSKLGLDFILSDNASNISGGQRQRIGIARGISGGADFLLFDESTNSLDKEKEIDIVSDIVKLKSTVIFVTHNVTILHFFDRIIHMSDGKIIFDDTYDSYVESNCGTLV